MGVPNAIDVFILPIKSCTLSCELLQQSSVSIIFLQHLVTSITCFADLGCYLGNYAISQNRKGFSSYSPFGRTTYVHSYLSKFLTVTKGKQVDPAKVNEVDLSIRCLLHGLTRRE